MRSILIALFYCLPAFLGADEALKLTVTLKDGQSMQGTLTKYDELTLDVANAQGTAFSIPWREVRSVTATEPSPDLGLMQQYIRPEPMEVGSLISAKDPGRCVKAALWPGILIHGSGYRAAGDSETFLSLAGGELFSTVLIGFGLVQYGSDSESESKATSLSIAGAGGAIFALTWAWDIFGAASAARSFNTRNHLVLAPLGDGAQAALAFDF